MAIYLLKINVALIILYGFYRAMFGQDTFFGWRRAMLIGIYIVALSIPLLDIETLIRSNESVVSMAYAYAEVVLPPVTVRAEAPVFSWTAIIWAVYLSITAFLAGRFVWQIASICRLAYCCRVQTIDGVRVHVMDGKGSPFSFFGWIFLNPDAQSAAQWREIIVHETTHVRQMHSLDVLFAELFGVVCWFNPFVWLLKREIRINLEYLADRSVIAYGNDRKIYQYHLLGLTYQKNVATISNNFNVLPLKKRIKMMNKRRTSKFGRVKYLLFVPLAAALLVISNIETVARSVSNGLEEIESVAGKPKTKVKKKACQHVTKCNRSSVDEEYTAVEPAENEQNSTQDDETKVYEVVEIMPQFEGGNQALMQFLAANCKYPKEAYEAKIQGRVAVSFVVRKDGSISNAKISRSVAPVLDAEALRVVQSMPKWIPGRQNGEPVNVKYIVPIMFKMDEPKGTEQPNMTDRSNVSDSKTSEVKQAENASDIDKMRIVVDGKPVTKEQFVVDGKPVTKEQFKALSPDRIKSVTVLKKENTVYITLKKE